MVSAGRFNGPRLIRWKKKPSSAVDYGDRSRILKSPDQQKVCSLCLASKFLRTDFYMCKGYYRSECKQCTISKNGVRQRESEVWKNRCLDPEKAKEYRLRYYSQNKGKFAEYRRKFKEKHPHYYRDRARRKIYEKS